MTCCVFLSLLALAGVALGGLSPNLAKDAAAIIALAKSQPSYGWDRLAFWVDSVGHRISGSDALENGLDLAQELMKKEGLDNVHGENATIPRWVRGDESLTMQAPYYKKMGALGLGTSVGGSVTAPVVVVETFAELGEHVRGKIVVYNQQCDWKAQPTGCYGATAQYRVDGARQASKFGAVATLTRSLTGNSIYTPHTGVMDYGDAAVKIPAACITVEDAELLSRMQARGVQAVLTLTMAAQNLAPRVSRNIIGEIRGTEHPDQVVMVGGHTDSWDVGQGAEDDGAGFMVSFEAVSLIKRLGLKPKRTIRLIGWVCEEFGGIGAQQYFDQHKDEAGNMSMVLESDLGVFTPYGLQFTAGPAATQVMTQIMAYAAPLNASAVVGNGGGEDSGPWMDAGVPGGAPYNDASTYFNFHHTNADMMTHVPVDTFESSAAAWAIAIWGVASMDEMLPRN